MFGGVLFGVVYGEKGMKREWGESGEEWGWCELDGGCMIVVGVLLGKKGKGM